MRRKLLIVQEKALGILDKKESGIARLFVLSMNYLVTTVSMS
jgi:hypothetical protein